MRRSHTRRTVDYIIYFQTVGAWAMKKGFKRGDWKSGTSLKNKNYFNSLNNVTKFTSKNLSFSSSTFKNLFFIYIWKNLKSRGGERKKCKKR